MLRIDVSVTGLKEAYDLIHRIEDMVQDDSNKEKVALGAVHEMATVFDRNFATSGKEVGGWAKPLADSTIRERERLGLPGEHPILIRYEDLREYTATSLQSVGASVTFNATDPQGGSIKVQVESQRGAVNITASGTKSVHQTGTRDGHIPARPYWFVNNNVIRAARKGGAEELAKGIKRL